MVRVKQWNEQVLRITAAYVEETRAGLRPRLYDYLQRFPMYGKEITSFVAYYHAIERVFSEEQEMASLPALSQQDIDFQVLPRLSSVSQRVLEQVKRSGGGERGGIGRNVRRAPFMEGKQHVDLNRIAELLDLSHDIVEKLVFALVDRKTVPRALEERLRAGLGLSLEAIQSVFSVHRPELLNGSRGLAEARACYGEDGSDDCCPLQSFREVVLQSPALQEEQRARWLRILNSEGP